MYKKYSRHVRSATALTKTTVSILPLFGSCHSEEMTILYLVTAFKATRKPDKAKLTDDLADHGRFETREATLGGK